jgi:hypothetical protein
LIWAWTQRNCPRRKRRQEDTHVDNTLSLAKDGSHRRANKRDFLEDSGFANQDVEQLLMNTGMLNTVSTGMHLTESVRSGFSNYCAESVENESGISLKSDRTRSFKLGDHVRGDLNEFGVAADDCLRHSSQ